MALPEQVRGPRPNCGLGVSEAGARVDMRGWAGEWGAGKMRSGKTYREEILLHPIPRCLVSQPPLGTELIGVEAVDVAVGVGGPGVDADGGLLGSHQHMLQQRVWWTWEAWMHVPLPGRTVPRVSTRPWAPLAGEEGQRWGTSAGLP